MAPVITTMEAMPPDDTTTTRQSRRWHTPIIATMEAMPPGNAPVQAVVPVIATMEAMPPVMALGGRLKQQQLLRRRSDGHGCRGREIQ